MGIFDRKDPKSPVVGLHAKPGPLSEETATNLGVARKSDKPLAAALAKLSTRERVLIVGLLIVALVTALVYFVLLPALERISNLQEEVIALQTERDELDSIIAQEAGWRDNYERSKKDYNVYQQFFSPYMTPEDLDRMVTQMLVDAGLDPTRLSMTSLAVEALPLYAPEPLVPNVLPESLLEGGAEADEGALAEGGAAEGGTGANSLDEAVTGGGAASDASDASDAAASDAALGVEGAGATSLANPTLGEGDASGEVYVYTVDIAADGDEDALFRFLEAIYLLYGIEVTTWSIQEASVIAPSSAVTASGGTGSGGSAGSAGSADGNESDAVSDSVSVQLKIYVFVGEPME
ncbi:MAG: hypothetical protein LBO07_02745 [Coriobacteriales bacterium]|jgi:type II secretory pathway component PulM|nr:hypothetical protein [Coriobacteriales bacterium]